MAAAVSAGASQCQELEALSDLPRGHRALVLGPSAADSLGSVTGSWTGSIAAGLNQHSAMVAGIASRSLSHCATTPFPHCILIIHLLHEILEYSVYA